MVEYSKEFQTQAANELREMGKTNQEIKVLLNDYAKLRKACKSLNR